jgi:hypothetical protein
VPDAIAMDREPRIAYRPKITLGLIFIVDYFGKLQTGLIEHDMVGDHQIYRLAAAPDLQRSLGYGQLVVKTVLALSSGLNQVHQVMAAASCMVARKLRASLS